MFADEAKIKIKAGDGGNGAVSFLHEKYREFGGPDGGDGGKGGDIIFEASDSINTLYYFQTNKFLKADSGENGKKRKRRGAGGEDEVIKVPVGTIILEDDRQVFDLDKAGIRTVVAIGGEGGFGNAHFTSSVRQAPRIAELGIKGEEKELTLKLKLVADVGLAGLPNAGKSTFLSVVTKATPKIADYPFTTIIPNLGVVEGYGLKRGEGFVIADIPGLIEGASKGKGLGDQFLRHVERTRVLLHLIDVNSEDLINDYEVINKELKDYNLDIIEKPQLVLLTKSDSISEEELQKKLKELNKHLKKEKKVKLLEPSAYPVSSVSHLGIQEVILKVKNAINILNKQELEIEEEEFKQFTLEDVKKDIFSIKKEDDIFIINGKKVERFALKTDFSNPHSVHRLRNILERTGIKKELAKKGAKDGDIIMIGKVKINFKN